MEVLASYGRIHDISQSGNHIPAKTWISVFSGKRICLETITKDDICLVDIWHALSNICRYGGQCLYFYSVAEHSIMLSKSCPKELKKAALIHDMAEAYIGDITSFVKYNLCKDIVKYEEKILKLICEIMEVDYADVERVKSYEGSLVAAEVEQLYPLNSDFKLYYGSDNEHGNETGKPLPPPCKGKFHWYAPAKAEDAFQQILTMEFGFSFIIDRIRNFKYAQEDLNNSNTFNRRRAHISKLPLWLVYPLKYGSL